MSKGHGQLVKGLRRRPLTAETRVRFPYWLLGKGSNLDRLLPFLVRPSAAPPKTEVD